MLVSFITCTPIALWLDPVCNDHEVDQNLATKFFADFPTKLPTMATMVTMLAVLGYGYILTDDQ